MKSKYLSHSKKLLRQPIVKYIIRRLLIGVIVIIGISVISFSTTYLLPSDPVTSRYPELSEQDRILLRAKMGLDQPLPVQYLRYIESIFEGEFGFSYNTGQPVINDLKNRLPASVELSFFALLFAIVIAVPLGIISSVYRNQLPDHLSRLFSIGSLSIPAFWVGVVCIYIFYYQLKLIPAPIGRLPLTVASPENVTGFFIIDSILTGNTKSLLGTLRSLFMPSFVLGLSIIAPISRITRSAMSEALQEDYIIFARSIGIPERLIIFQDALMGSLVSILTIIGYIMGYLVAGAALVETVFAWPGIGRYAVEAIVTSDMAPINTVLLLIAIGIAVINLVVDLGYAVIDPRIRHGFINQQGGVK